MLSLFFVLFVVIFQQVTTENLHKPNIVLIITDDQDVNLGGMMPMVKTKRLIGDTGATFSHAYVTTPVCCPSRASIMTGKYAHNHGVINNTLEGGCAGQAWINYQEPFTMAAYLQKAGYETFFGGKYLNDYGKEPSTWTHLPPGWNHWYGLIGNSVYYNYSLSINGKSLEKHTDKKEDYLTNVLSNKAVRFLQNHNNVPFKKPFFLMLCPPAPHSPFEPYSTYEKAFKGLRAPRTPSFDYHCSDKHWLVRRTPENLKLNTIQYIDRVYRRRWRTLLSVDDMVERLIKTLMKLNLYNSTYIIYMSDNGYHLGQFCLPLDKRQPYETDIQIPMLIRGPGVKMGKVIEEIVLNIDVAPTVLEMANISLSIEDMDGKSFYNIIKESDKEKNGKNDERHRPSVKRRKNFLIEYWGEAGERGVDKSCAPGGGKDFMKNLSQCHIDEQCVCQDARNNTYRCVREISTPTGSSGGEGRSKNFLYCQFLDDQRFVEAYDIGKDKWQMNNLIDNNWEWSSSTDIRYFERRLDKLTQCRAYSCV